MKVKKNLLELNNNHLVGKKLCKKERKEVINRMWIKLKKLNKKKCKTFLLNILHPSNRF